MFLLHRNSNSSTCISLSIPLQNCEHFDGKRLLKKSALYVNRLHYIVVVVVKWRDCAAGYRLCRWYKQGRVRSEWTNNRNATGPGFVGLPWPTSPAPHGRRGDSIIYGPVFFTDVRWSIVECAASEIKTGPCFAVTSNGRNRSGELKLSFSRFRFQRYNS